MHGSFAKTLISQCWMQKLRHMRAQNPIYPQFQPMQLYEKIGVRRCVPLGSLMRMLVLCTSILLCLS